MPKVKPELDRRRKYYMILDCETATLPFANEIPEARKKDLGIAKPLIYDLGWIITDKKGNIYKRRQFLIAEIFSVPSVFNTAYYAWKRPIYFEKLNQGEISVVPWKVAIAVLEKDMELVQGVGAYNAMFDFKKAIPFTELYISKLYSPDFYRWEEEQKENFLKNKPRQGGRTFESEIFRFHSKIYPLFDVWGLACEHLLNNDEYRRTCIDNEWTTASGKYFSSSAETAYRFCSGNFDFEEAHTALADCEIETFLFSLAIKKFAAKFEPSGIAYFPFKVIGKVESFSH